MLSRFRSPACLAVMLLLFPLAAIAHGETKRVLVLSSGERPFAPQSGFADALVGDLIRASREPIQFVEASVHAARESDEAPDVSVAQRIRSTFGGQKLDLVITIGGPAAMFAQQFRAQLFPATPTLIAGVDRRFVEHGTFSDNETTVATDHDPALMIDEILRLLPDTRSVMVIVGASQVEQFWLQQMRREFSRFGDRLQFTWTNDMSFERIAERSAAMPPQSAIFFALLSVDGNGEPQVDGDTVKRLHAVANAPMFSLFGMGNGVVGGPMMAIGDLSRTTTQVALRLLAGELPGRIQTPIQRPGRPIYDDRELHRWNIDERLLPPSSSVLFREPTSWERNRRPLAIGALLGGIPVVAFVLVAGVRRRRRSAANPSGSSAAPSAPEELELTNLSRHLIQEQERERAALAKTLHEDVGQRMVALTVRLHSLQGVEHPAKVAEIREELAGLTAEIAAASDAVYGRLELLGLAAVARQLCEELSTRYGVTLYFHDQDVPRKLPPDIALALFRVLQEAAVNAAVHSQAREVWVSMRGSTADVHLHVVDRGRGFDPQRTVAGPGVGLVAIRERLKIVNGESRIVSRPGQGTRVEAWVPLPSAREPLQ